MGSYSPEFFKPTNITGIAGFLKYINDLSGGIFIPMFIVVMWVLSYSWSQQRNNDQDRALQLSSVVAFVLTGLFIAANVIPANPNAVLAVVALGLTAYATLKVRRNG